MQGFVGHDGHVEALLQARQRGAVAGLDGLLDQVDATRFQRGDAAHGIRFAPGLVDVDAHAGTFAQRPLDLQHVGHVIHHVAQPDLQLEDAVAAQVQHFFPFGDIARGVAAGQHPGHGQRIAHPAAQQFRQRHVQAARLRIEQRRLDRALGEAVALNDLAYLGHRLGHCARFHADQQRRDIGIDIRLDAFRAFAAIAQAADGGRLAPARDAVGAAQPHQHQGLRVHGGDGHPVRADGWHIDQVGLDILNHIYSV